MELSVQNISFGYKQAEYSLFEDVGFHITGPGFYSLFGFSGCGKSTLARIIAGLIQPSQGEVVLEDLKKILLSYNTERLPGWITVEEHLLSVLSQRSSKEELDYFIREFGLFEYVDKRFFRLSMGQKNRANLIRYLIQDFDMLICDEVLANVDEPSRNHILSVMKEAFGEKRLIFYISHNVEEVCLFSKKILVIPAGDGAKGRLIEIEGLDKEKPSEGKQGLDRKLLQETILKVLRAASTGEGEE